MQTTENKPNTPAVYAAIAAVMADLSREGITKDRRNSQGAGYAFRGIDDVYNALAPILARHQLMILPLATDRHQEERESKSGGALYYTTVKMSFALVSGVDGSQHTIATYGEAMDSSDKGTNKAMSAAFKYAAFQAFCIPTEGDNDADASTHQPAPRVAKPSPAVVGTPVTATVEMATDEQKMDLAAYQIDDRTKDGVAKALAFYQEKEGVEIQTLKGLTKKAAATILAKCEAALKKGAA